VLDSSAEESFDRYTRLAVRLLGVPVALVSLVEGDRQFFKSCVGLPLPWATERETPLSHSFCQHVVTRMLVRSGYTVATAASAEEALGRLEDGGARVDVVLTDIVMPGMGAGALVRHLAEHHPGLGVVFMSGYTDEVITLNGVLNDSVRLLRKPFTQAELVREVSAVVRPA
jgi:CheY-like chemotaxis protein